MTWITSHRMSRVMSNDSSTNRGNTQCVISIRKLKSNSTHYNPDHDSEVVAWSQHLAQRWYSYYDCLAAILLKGPLSFLLFVSHWLCGSDGEEGIYEYTSVWLKPASHWCTSSETCQRIGFRSILFRLKIAIIKCSAYRYYRQVQLK